MKIIRINKVDNYGKLKAFFDIITGDGFIIKGFRLMESIDGNHWVGFPSQKDKDGEYHDTAFCNKQIKEQLEKLANDVYKNPSLVESTKEIPQFEGTREKVESLATKTSDEIPF